jgi:hypothetical protein
MPAFQGGIDPGVLRRLLILQFNRTIPEKERNGAVERLPIEYADDFLAWIVDGASRYIRQGGFTVPESSRAALEEWSRQADPALGWIADRISPVHATDDKCTTAEAHADFELYCRAEFRMRDRDIPRVRTFVDRCKAAFKGKGEIRHGHSGNFRGFFGMRLREPTEAMQEMANDGEWSRQLRPMNRRAERGGPDASPRIWADGGRLWARKPQHFRHSGRLDASPSKKCVERKRREGRKVRPHPSKRPHPQKSWAFTASDPPAMRPRSARLGALAAPQLSGERK